MAFRPLDKLIDRRTNAGEDQETVLERMSREIKGSIYTLTALFELVALASYLPLDSFHLKQQQFDNMNNMAGIVGAVASEFFLGNVGIAGYSVVLLTLWLAFDAFRGTPLRHNLYRFLGTVLGTFLTAITCFLVLNEKFPATSLLQGGRIGKLAGVWLRTYFNTTGAMLLVGGGFVITLLLTTNFSITSTLGSVFGNDDADEEDDENALPAKRILIPVPATAAAAPSNVTNIQAAKKKPRRKKKTDGDTADGADGATADPAQLASVDGIGPDAPAKEGPYEFEPLIPYTGSYSQPSTRLLKDSENGKKLSRGEIKDNSRKLIEHLLSFQITGTVTNVTQGPVLVTYEFKPSAGIKLSKIENLQDDLGVVFGTNQLRVIAPIPGKTVVGIEVPRKSIDTISLKEIVREKAFYDKKIKLPIALGKTTDGLPVVGDMAAMPHLLVAGSTGSGKSVFVNSLIISLMYRHSPADLRFILVDPKMLEFAAFDGLPHLITNVITNNNVAFTALNWAVDEMERRYRSMAESGSKNIESFNAKQKGANKLPFIVIVIDELADLMMSGGEMVEVAITRLAQKARACGIHLVIATQRPSTDVVTGLIKANVPSRISFKVPSGIDSRTVLDTGGAETLIGRGDSLMIVQGVPLRRIHGTFVSEDELARVVKYIKDGKNHAKNYLQFTATNPDK